MGNTVVLKPATYTRLTALLFAEICAEAGLPPSGHMVSYVLYLAPPGAHELVKPAKELVTLLPSKSRLVM